MTVKGVPVGMPAGVSLGLKDVVPANVPVMWDGPAASTQFVKAIGYTGEP